MLKHGDRVQAKLIEAVDKTHWIVSFEGQLLQVTNHTGETFTPGQQLTLLVENERPLRLSLAQNKSRKSINLRA